MSFCMNQVRTQQNAWTTYRDIHYLQTGKDDTEKTINLIVSNKHGVVMKSIKEATSSDPVLQDILKIMKQNDWEKHKDRPEIKPYFLIRD